MHSAPFQSHFTVCGTPKPTSRKLVYSQLGQYEFVTYARSVRIRNLLLCIKCNSAHSPYHTYTYNIIEIHPKYIILSRFICSFAESSKTIQRVRLLARTPSQRVRLPAGSTPRSKRFRCFRCFRFRLLKTHTKHFHVHTFKLNLSYQRQLVRQDKNSMEGILVLLHH